eukprot:CAMPEP_0185553428 /NCGR_PEP_ID=MMETSP1381-20130426/37845_1 /TAXON_ID=298111 /ORGANISM="Pavlova sp., Strain CCMP459" /LENGTH=57 /DNA_ID=CAMNT_0028166537 /DNA_START=63 /DNA_END=236 /DNA_ORIENTATION=+
MIRHAADLVPAAGASSKAGQHLGNRTPPSARVRPFRSGSIARLSESSVASPGIKRTE